MSLYRNGVSPNLLSTPFTPPLLQPLGYMVDSSQNNRRREINSLKDLRREIRADRTFGKLFVIHNHDARVLEALEVDATSSRQRATAKEGGVWAWEYPDMSTGRSVEFSSVSLYQKERFWVFLIASPKERTSRHLPPRLKHQDAATRTSALRTASFSGNTSEKGSGTLDEELCAAFAGGEVLEDVLGELVFERWLGFLDCLSSKDCSWRREKILYQALHSLERNQDFVRHLAKHSQTLLTPSHQDVSDLLARLHRHILLLPKPPTPATSEPSSSSSSSSSDRALDRISYLGGLLLPITVVSSVLAIEGDYGPEGNNFWVFWVASAVASVVAIGLIHVDQVRGVDVWREVAEEFGIAGFGGDEDGGGVRDGHGLVWERRQLGWGGAVKKVSGYYRVRGMKGLKFDRPDDK